MSRPRLRLPNEVRKLPADYSQNNEKYLRSHQKYYEKADDKVNEVIHHEPIDTKVVSSKFIKQQTQQPPLPQPPLPPPAKHSNNNNRGQGHKIRHGNYETDVEHETDFSIPKYGQFFFLNN